MSGEYQLYSKKMKHYGLIGYPLGHSFSQAFFTEKFEREQLAAQYLNIEIRELDELLDIVRKDRLLCGLNVTIPYKSAVIPLLDKVDPEALAIGAVNVIRITRDTTGKPQLVGFNSDIVGFRESLRPLLLPSHRHALLLGTGGASKAVDYALRQLGLKVTFVSRSTKAGVIPYEAVTADVIAAHGVIVNATPLGMYPKVNSCPDIPYAALTSDHLLYDLVYNPEETLFLQKGRAVGASVKNGLEMLHRQAIAAWELWR